MCFTLGFTFLQGARWVAPKTADAFVHLTVSVGSQQSLGLLVTSVGAGRVGNLIAPANSSTSGLGLMGGAPPGKVASWGHCSALGIHPFIHSVSQSVTQHHPLSQEKPPLCYYVGDSKWVRGNSLVVQWVTLCAPNAGGTGSIPGQGTRSCRHAATKDPACCNQDPTCHN